MKRYAMVLLIFSFMFLAMGCFDTDTPRDEPDDQLPPPQELTQALQSIATANNYRLDIVIDMDFIELRTIMLFDGQKTYYELLGEVIYLSNEADICYHYATVEDQMTKTVIDCHQDDQTYGFYKYFDDTWFVKEDDRYRLKDEHYALLNEFVQHTMPDAIASDFFLTLANNQFQSMVFTVTVDDEIFHFTIEFSQYGRISIRLPEVN